MRRAEWPAAIARTGTGRTGLHPSIEDERIAMKRLKLLATIPVGVALWIALSTPALAAPPSIASCLAYCASTMGGQHVAACALAMEKGVSTCAQMTPEQCPNMGVPATR